MATEEESWRKQFASDGNGGGERPHRPSYNRPTGGYQRERREYRTNDGYNREGGYRQREGGYQRETRGNRQGGGYNRNGYQSRDNRPYNHEGGYRQREEGYQPRPYNREEGHASRPYNREGGYQQREGGYRQNNGYGQRPNGGYKKRPSSNYNPHAKYSMKKQIEYKEKNYDPDEPVRLNRFLANAGVCSRREADTFIQAGVVKVNGNIVTELGTKVKRSDEVMFHDQTINMEKKVYLLLNKPKDYVTTSDDPQNRKTVMDLVKNACRERIYPIGRLDRNTTGVLLFTNDGDLAAKLTHPKFGKKKIYAVTLDRDLDEMDEDTLRAGVMIDDEKVKPDALEFPQEDRKHIGIEIHSGQNRVVRRMFEKVGYRVTKLDRVSFAGLTKKNVARGKYRFLTPKEVAMLQMGAFE